MEIFHIIASYEAKSTRKSMKTNLLLTVCMSGCKVDNGVTVGIPTMQYYEQYIQIT